MTIREQINRWVWGGAAALALLSGPAMAFQSATPDPWQGYEEMMKLVAAVGGSSYLGVDVCEIDHDRARALNLKEERGVEITRLQNDGPAAKGGLKVGDVVLEYNGQRVEGTQQFMRLVRETPAAREVRLTVSRNGAPLTLTVVTGSQRDRFPGNFSAIMPLPPATPMAPLPPQAPDGNFYYFGTVRGARLGIEAEQLNPQLAQFFGVKTGVLVRSVVANSAAEKAGLKAGDVITKIDGTAVASVLDVNNAVHGAAGKGAVPVMVVRDKHEMTLSATIEDKSSNEPPLRSMPVRLRDRI